jgi:hypothetical protein
MIPIEKYVLGGNATFTLRSLKTGNRFTFRIQQPGLKPTAGEDGAIKPPSDVPHFVSVLTGPQNEADYAFLGTIFSDGNYRHGKKSRIARDAKCAIAFEWFWNNHNCLRADLCEFFPSGKCCCCGRTLTTPESVEAGIGPVCASM